MRISRVCFIRCIELQFLKQGDLLSQLVKGISRRKRCEFCLLLSDQPPRLPELCLEHLQLTLESAPEPRISWAHLRCLQSNSLGLFFAPPLSAVSQLLLSNGQQRLGVPDLILKLMNLTHRKKTVSCAVTSVPDRHLILLPHCAAIPKTFQFIEPPSHVLFITCHSLQLNLPTTTQGE